MLTEADTCRKYVLPALYAAGWNDDQISAQNSFTDGRIIVAGAAARRGPQKRADYLLRYRPHLMLAVVEAKAPYKKSRDGLQQAKDYAQILDLQFASILKEMRDAAGENGEFYTPRPVVQFIAAAVDPRLGETVLDPACGTGGFLAAAFEHLKKQCKTAEDHRRLQRDSLFGIEAKPLPYLLCQMNLLLHGLEYPNIDSLNALRFPLREIGEKDRVDVIITNTPFGGEEEKGIQGNFPEDKQTSETALLFLQFIMRKLRRMPKAGFPAARAAVVVPNGTLFGDGVCARIKEELLKGLNLHTVVRLPNGVFSPYTSIPTNMLFFDRSGQTKEVWYYEHPLPNGRKNHTKTQPIQFDEFAPCLAWWKRREENDRAWRVGAEELLAGGCNLDRKNPRGKEDNTYRPPEALVQDILAKERRIMDIMSEITAMLEKGRVGGEGSRWLIGASTSPAIPRYATVNSAQRGHGSS